MTIDGVIEALKVFQKGKIFFYEDLVKLMTKMFGDLNKSDSDKLSSFP